MLFQELNKDHVQENRTFAYFYENKEVTTLITIANL